ncbi:MAG: DNA recombination protein RmuC [Lewinellaceae bacterium]|nr:DNA recombination protein RmuC [Saprospiraceae bacterium]MCB9312222.1 DNA recombination protein RmuC [Lewinellaceae bacterium]
MTDTLLILLWLTFAISLISLILALVRKGPDADTLTARIREELLQSQLLGAEQVRSEFRSNREEQAQQHHANREATTSQLNAFGEQQARLLQAFQSQLNAFIDSNQKRGHELQESLLKSLADIRFEVNRQLETLQKDNHAQLERMRETVDEKLHKTLEERLGQSFKTVSEHLEKVQLGLGEMQTLATGVGDLKRVLSNVKTRGVMGEIQLGNILEQLLTPDQYGLNVATIPNSGNHVEFAVKFPGKDKGGDPIWLPIDSKFPMDRYEQVLAAYEDGRAEIIDAAQKELLRTVKIMARDIREKYIAPPHTTDFGVLFLPIEGLYAEVVRHPGLMEELQRDQRILIAGPTNLAAFLNALQMGFRSIAIEQRSSEVWKTLGAVKAEFGKFGDVLALTRKKLQEATNVIDKADVRTRAIERKLRDVEELPGTDSPSPLADGLDLDDLVGGSPEG